MLTQNSTNASPKRVNFPANFSKDNSEVKKELSDVLDTTCVNEFIKDFEELRVKRDMRSEWACSNVKRATAEQATKLLGYPAKSDGLWIEGYGGQGQFKPDEPWEIKGSKPKYLTPKGEYSAIFPTHPQLGEEIWTNTEVLKECCVYFDGDSTAYIVITEGGFKAIAGCSFGIATIGLLGVWMGLTPSGQRNRHLLPILQEYAQSGFGFIIAFDADCATNKKVVDAQTELAHALTLTGSPVRVATGLWTVEQGKGMDDFIKEHGAWKFTDEVLAKAQLWEKQFSKTEVNRKLKKSPIELGQMLAEDFRTEWSYHHEQQTWRSYNGKTWDKLAPDLFESLVYQQIKGKEIELKSPLQVTGAVATLKNELIIPEWKPLDRRRFIAFDNLVYDSYEKKTEEYKPGFRLTSKLPYPYQEIDVKGSIIDALKENCPNIYAYMNRAMDGDSTRIKLLLAIINAVIKFRFFEFQKFVYLIGKSGAGKGTFVRLLTKVVGEVNSHGGKAANLTKAHYIAAWIDKQLVTFPDERKKISVDGLLELTGGDKIEYRDLYKSAASSYFYGTIVITANNPIFIGDTTGIDRRQVLVHFNTTIPKEERSSKIEELYDAEISALISVVLSMADDEVESIIKGEGDAEIPAFKLQEWLVKVQNDSLAAFIDERIIFERGKSFETYIGDGNLEKPHYKETLFGSYKEFIKYSGGEAKKLHNFSEALISLMSDVLGWDVKKAKRKSKGVPLVGEIRLRVDGFDDEIPPLSYQMQLAAEFKAENNNCEKSELSPTYPTQSASSKDYNPTLSPTLTLHSGLHKCRSQEITDESQEMESSQCRTECRTSVGLSVGLKPLPSKDSVGHVGLEGENTSIVNSFPFKEKDIAIYCGDNEHFRDERVLVKQILDYREGIVAIQVVGGFKKEQKYLECPISDLKPLETD